MRDSSDAELVSRIGEFLLAEFAEFARDRLPKITEAIRAELAGERVHIRKPSEEARTKLADEALRLFNGRNASEVARRLGIGRATVYRMLKRAGRAGGW